MSAPDNGLVVRSDVEERVFRKVLDYLDSLLEDEELSEARQALQLALALRPDSIQAWDREEAVKAALIPGWHFAMVNDVNRNSSYRSALTRVLSSKPDCLVLDVGTGTGLLALYAARAARGDRSATFACEINTILHHVAREVLLDSPVRLLPHLSADLSVLEHLDGRKVDLLVTETFDCGLFGEHSLAILDHAWKELLAEDATVIPNSAKVFFAPIECAELSARHRYSKDTLGNLDAEGLVLIKETSEEESYDAEDLDKLDFRKLSEDTELVSVTFGQRSCVSDLYTNGRSFEVEVLCFCQGVVHALAVWFRLDLCDGVSISTRPRSLNEARQEEGKTCWEQAIFPLQNPISADAGDLLLVKFHLQDKLTLEQCSKKKHRETPKEVPTVLAVPECVLTMAGDRVLMNMYELVVRDLSLQHRHLRVLDLTDDVLLTLQLLKAKESTTGSIFFARHSRETAALVHRTCALAERNGVERRLDVESAATLGKDVGDTEAYNVLCWSPVTASGRLNHRQSFSAEMSCRHLMKAMNDNPIFLPRKARLFCQLLESDKLVSMTRVDQDNETTRDFPRLAEVLNEHAPSHVDGIDINRIAVKPLCEPVHVCDFGPAELLSDTCPPSIIDFSIPAKENGLCHAILYWFVMDFGVERTFSTFDQRSEQSHFKQALFLTGNNSFRVVSDRAYGLRYRFEAGLFDIKYIQD